MAIRVWVGNAPVTPRVIYVQPVNPHVNDLFTITYNAKSVSYQCQVATVADVVAGLVAAWNGSQDPTIKTLGADVGYTTDGDPSSGVTAVRLSNSDGTDFSVTVSVGWANTASIAVATTTTGSSTTVNEIQTIVMPSPNGGTWTFTLGGNTTGNLAWNISAADLQTAITGLASVGANNCTVTGSGTGLDPFVLTFVSGKAATNMAQGTASGANLLGIASAAVKRIRAGTSTATNEIQQWQIYRTSNVLSDPPLIYVYHPTNGAILAQFFLNNNNTAAINTINAALGTWLTAAKAAGIVDNAASLSGEPNALASSTGQYQGGTLRITFSGSWTGQNLPNPVTSSSASGAPVDTVLLGGVLTLRQAFTNTYATYVPGTTTLQNGNTTGTSEIQKLTVTSASGGTFVVGYNPGSGVTYSGTIAYNANAATVQSALDSLIGSGQTTVTGDATQGWTVTFGGSLNNTAVLLMTVDGSLLSGGTVTTSTTVNGSSTVVNEVQTITLANAAGGTWTAAFQGKTTSAFPYNETSANVQTALRALSTVGASNVNVSGSSGGPYSITFVNSLAGSNVADLVVDGSSLSSGDNGARFLDQVVKKGGTGPNRFDEPENWRDASNVSGLPQNGDDVWYIGNDIDCIAGLSQATLTLNSLNVDMSYTGRIGLPLIRDDGGIESNPQYLAVAAAVVNIGSGTGQGSERIKIDTGTTTSVYHVKATGSPADTSTGAVIFKCNSSSTVLHFSKGYVGIAPLPLETAVIGTINQGYVDNAESDTVLILGEAATVTTHNKRGGECFAAKSPTTIINDAGDYSINARAGKGAIGLLKVRGGTVAYAGLDTITTAHVFATGTLDLRGAQGSCVIGQLYLYVGYSFLDPFGRVTHSNPPQWIDCAPQDGTLEVGRNVKATLVYF